MTQYYIGSKQIMAWPQHKDGQEGYTVKCPDGYQSWSPKATFEAAYLPMGHENDGTKITEQMVDDFIIGYEDTRLGTTTVVQAQLRNGFTVLESSACVDPANYDHDLGVSICKSRIKPHVWRLLGFLLASARNGV
jgi:hypothetical protein